jgi:hypothetical protein
LADFGNLIKTVKDVAAIFNGGTVKGMIDNDVELLEIEPLHTTINGESIILLIEPSDLGIDNSVNIGMGGAGNYYGRADNIPSYTGTSRTINLYFKMVKSYILNGAEAVSSNTMTTNLLQQLVYPAYIPTTKQSTSVLKTPPYFRILYGDLVGDFKGGQRKGLPGYISNLNVRQAGRGIGENLTYGVNETMLPISYSVNITFNVLHDHTVGWYDGKFAEDGRTNWPYNTGIVIDQTADGPGGDGGNVVGDVLGAAAAIGAAGLVGKALQSTTGNTSLSVKKSSNAIKKGLL